MVSGKGRKRHSWDPKLATHETDGTLTSRCANCGMVQHHGWYRGQGNWVYDVLQWSSPQGVLVGIRPVVDLYPQRDAPPLSETFAGIPVRRMPECPKEHAAWRAIRAPEDCW